MDGPGHYREAEQLLTPQATTVVADGYSATDGHFTRRVPCAPSPPTLDDIAQALAHATLALVAAVLAPALDNATWGRTERANDWREALR